MNNQNKTMLAISSIFLAILACTRVTPEPIKTIPRPLPTVASSPLPTSTRPSGASDIIKVQVLAELVNIRTSKGETQGVYARREMFLVVRIVEGDGFAVILNPLEWKGMKIWRGCTSEPAGYGCEMDHE